MYPLGADLFQAQGRKVWHKANNRFRNFSKAPKKHYRGRSLG
jgi:hypothetical protein